LDPEEPVQTATLQNTLIEIRPDTEFLTDPLIDDPVTGAGNEDLWISDEEESEDESDDEEREDGDGSDGEPTQ